MFPESAARECGEGSVSGRGKGAEGSKETSPCSHMLLGYTSEKVIERLLRLSDVPPWDNTVRRDDLNQIAPMNHESIQV